MKKCLLIITISLLCLLLTGTVMFTALFMTDTHTDVAFTPDDKVLADNDAQTPSIMELAEEEKTFNTTIPITILYGEALTVANSPNNIGSVTVVDDYVKIVPSGSDPYYAPASEFEAGRYVVIKYRSDSAATTTLQFFMGSTGSAPLDDTSMMETNVVADGQWQTVIFDTQPLIDADVYNGTFASFFRFDPIEAGYKLNENGEPYKNESGGWEKYELPANATMDVQFIGFFETQADAEGFDYAEYLAKIAYEKEIGKYTDWPDPTYKSMNTTAKDTAKGTLTYTPSADGSTVTIEYEVDGEKVSYTVPNNVNYLSGGFSATDDLGRSLYNSAEVGIYGSNGEHYVGLFYFLWHGEHGDHGIYNLQEIMETKGEAAKDATSGVYGPIGAMHWFAEPLYGYYYANDTWVMQKHAELLANANVDFLYIDVTNGYTYRHNATKLMAILHELNEQGYDAPQVVFYTNSNAENTVRELYNNIYSQGLFEDTWFCIDGKPVIVAPYEANINDFFHIKLNQWPNETTKQNGWPWMDFTWPQRVFTDENGNRSAISVSIAQHNYTVTFSDSSLYNDFRNRGRSFNAPVYATLTAQKYKKAFDADHSLSLQGLNFQAQWDHAIKEDVPYVLVTGWNEWVAQRQDGSVHRNDATFVHFVDTASIEYSRDAEMMRGGYFDNYYIQLVYNIERLKGAAPIVVQDSRKPINVTGGFNQWDDVIVTYTDVEGDTVERDAIGFGKTPYKDDSGRNDIAAAKVTGDTKNVYFYVETVDHVTMYNNNSTWMQLFVNVDRDTTGWYGYDYIINYSAKDTFTTTVAKYNGTDGEYSFEIVGNVSYRAKENRMMIAVPLEMLGIENYLEINLEFKWADSDTVINTMEQFYTDGDAAPLGRLNYVYQNYMPAEAPVETEPETTVVETTVPVESATTVCETTASGETAPEFSVSAETPVVTEPQTTAHETTVDSNGSIEPTIASNTSSTTDSNATSGCASMVASGVLVSVMGILTLAGVCLKKKN